MWLVKFWPEVGKLLFDVFELTNNCMQLILEHINVIVSAMIVVKHHGGLHIIVNGAPADLRRWPV